MSFINNHDSHSKNGNDDKPGPKYPNESESEEGETNKTSALPNFIPQVLPNDEGPKIMQSMMGIILNQSTYLFQAMSHS